LTLSISLSAFAFIRCNGYQAVYRVSFVDFFFFLALALGSKFSVVRCVLRPDPILFGVCPFVCWVDWVVGTLVHCMMRRPPQC
jgi:hypothetical protein